MLVIGERVRSHFPEVYRDTSNSQIHLAQFVRRICVLLSIDRDFLFVSVMRFHELHGLHKHTARSAARVIENAIIRFNHFGNQIYNTLRRVELALTFAFCKRELAQEVFVNPPDDVVLFIAGIDLINLVQKRCQLCSINMKTRVIVVG